YVDASVLSSSSVAPPRSPLFPYTTLFRSHPDLAGVDEGEQRLARLHDLAHLHCAPRHAAGDGREDHRILEVELGLLQGGARLGRSEEHTSELQSRGHLVCRPLLEKKKIIT